MKSDFSFSRYTLFWVVIGCYLLPLVFLCLYNTLATESGGSWDLMGLGLFLTSLGTLTMFLMMTKWEKVLQMQYKDRGTIPETHSLQPSDPIPSVHPVLQAAMEKHTAAAKALEDAQEANIKLNGEIKTLSAELEQMAHDKDQQEKHLAQIQAELEECRYTSCEQLKQQQSLIREFQETIAEQKGMIEKKQQQISQLDTKVSDLTYEIKTLLQIAESHISPLVSDTRNQSVFNPKDIHEDENSVKQENQIRTGEEASHQLRRCLDIAQKITGSNRFNSQINSFLDSPVDSFSIDLRRLCDSLRSESNSAILLYSPKENQLLFANNQIKDLTGWSPDKFIQNFSGILNDDIAWKQGIASLAMKSEAQLKFSLKAKSGQEIHVNGHLGMIPTGIFKHHAIAVLY